MGDIRCEPVRQGLHVNLYEGQVLLRCPSIALLECIEETWFAHDTEASISRQMSVLAILLNQSLKTTLNLSRDETHYLFELLADYWGFSFTEVEEELRFTFDGNGFSVDDLLLVSLTMQGGSYKGENRQLERMPLTQFFRRLETFRYYKELEQEAYKDGQR